MNSFRAEESTFFRLYHERHFEDALRLAQELQKRFPMEEAKILYWQVCLHSILKQLREAENKLKELIERGYWISPNTMKTDPDLDSVRDSHFFREALCDFALKEAEEARRSVPVTVEVPTQTDDQSSQRVIVALHWRFGNASSFAQLWAEPARNNLARVIAVQSSQIAGPGQFCWDNIEVAKREVTGELYRHFRGKIPQASHLILGGASQGGRLALEMTMEGYLRPGKLVLVVPALREPESLFATPPLVPEGLEILMLGGTEDRFTPCIEKLQANLERSGISSRMKLYEKLGHDFPDDFGDVLTGFL